MPKEPENQPDGVPGTTPMDVTANEIASLLDDDGYTDADGRRPAVDSEEAAPEESEGEPEAEAEADPAEEDEEEETPEEEPEEEAEEPAYTVVIDGKKESVTLEELKSGYQRGADYTRKTQSLAQERRQLEQVAQQVSQERNQYAQAINQLQSQMQNEYQQFQNVNWDQLREEDPIAYIAKKDEMRDLENRYRQAESEKHRVQQQQQLQEASEFKRRLNDEKQLLEMAVPEFKDPEKRAPFQQKLRQFALRSGYTEDEIANLYDHRAVMILDKARRYDEIIKSKPAKKKVVQKTKTAKPGAGREGSASQRERFASKYKRLQKEGTVQAAGDLLADFL